MIKLAYTIIYVSDVTKTVEFYEQVFGLECVFISPENDYGELKTGKTKLCFASLELANQNLKDGFLPLDLTQKPFGMEIGFTTDNVPALVERALSAGATHYGPVATKPWGQVVAYIRDPNGFLIEICSPMES